MTDTTNDPLEQAEQFNRDYEAVRQQIARVVVGQQETVEGVLACLFVGGHALLEGVPGLGKTLLIRTLSRALTLKFSRVQFTPDLMPADITGTTIVVESDTPGQSRRFQFQPGPVFAQIVLADEINRATPKTQSALLEAMQERSVTVAGVSHQLEQPFLVLATQNPIEQEGTYPLPEAQLDRFLLKLQVPYVTRDEMHTILERTTSAAEAAVDAVLDADAILNYQRLIREVLIAPHVRDYAVRCVLATHADSEFAPPAVRQFVRFGASPRGAQALVLCAKVRALLDGRKHVSIEDIQHYVLPALRHRVLLNFEGHAEGVTTDTVLQEVRQSLTIEPATT